MESRPKALAEVALRVSHGASFQMELADFLDEFRQQPDKAALTEEPLALGMEAPERLWIDAYLAAVAEMLSGRQG